MIFSTLQNDWTPFVRSIFCPQSGAAKLVGSKADKGGGEKDTGGEKDK